MEKTTSEWLNEPMINPEVWIVLFLGILPLFLGMSFFMGIILGWYIHG
jgi:hypothetical protein